MVLVMAVLAIAVSPAFAAENLQRISGGDPHLLASPQNWHVTNGAAKYQRDNPADKRVFVIDLGDGFYQSVARSYTTEGIHPNIAQGGRLAGAIAGLIQRQLLALNQGTVKSSP
jgi:hypothetical protein